MKHQLAFVIIFLLAITNMYAQSDSIATDSVEKVPEIFTVVETNAEFPGGYNAMIDFISQNVVYPKKARKKKLQGKVYVQFVVRADGKVINAKVLRGIGGGCDEEALRVVKKMPMWKPGTQRGEPVSMYFNLPINFMLTEEK